MMDHDVQKKQVVISHTWRVDSEGMPVTKTLGADMLKNVKHYG